MSEISCAEQIDAELRVEADSNPLIAMVDAMRPEMHNKACCASKYFGNGWMAQMEVREAAQWVAGGAHQTAERLCSTVEGINLRGHNRPDWSRLILDACGQFDVEMVRALLGVGVRADQLYTDHDGNPWDLATWTLQSYIFRAQVFQDAPALWADKAAEIAALTIAAGGPQWLGVWIGPELAPVLVSRHLDGLALRGGESWQELQDELGLDDGDLETAALALLEQAGAFELTNEPQGNGPAAERLTQRVDEYLAWVESWGDPEVDGCLVPAPCCE
jgi:hypothetical protein